MARQKLPKALICPLPHQLESGEHAHCPGGVGCLEEWAAAAFDGRPAWDNRAFDDEVDSKKDALSPLARQFVREVLQEVGLAPHSGYVGFDCAIRTKRVKPIEWCYAWRIVAEREPWGYDTRNQPRLTRG